MRLTRFSGKASGRHLASACRRALGAIAATVPRLPSPVDGQVPSIKTPAMPVTPDVVLVYLHPHAAANEPVTLLEGPIAIQGGATGTGTLTLRWLPSTGLRLEADLNSMDAPQPGARVKVDLAGSTAEVLFNSILWATGHRGRSLKWAEASAHSRQERAPASRKLVFRS